MARSRDQGSTRVTSRSFLVLGRNLIWDLDIGRLEAMVGWPSSVVGALDACRRVETAASSQTDADICAMDKFDCPGDRLTDGSQGPGALPVGLIERPESDNV